MNKKIIIIEGYLASGKSTFAVRLSRAAGVPYLIKDTFKTALCGSISLAGREESSRFSAVTFDGMMYVAERMFETGYPLILEGNFVPEGVKHTDEAGVIRRLVCQYGYEALTYEFRGDPAVLHKRFLEREKTPERGLANVIGKEVSCEDFSRWCRNLDGFEIGGERVRVDATDFNKVDFRELIDTGKRFIASK